MTRRDLFGMRRQSAVPPSRGDLATLEAFYAQSSAARFPAERVGELRALNDSLNGLLRELLEHADTSRLARASVLSKRHDSTDLVVDLREGRVAVMAGITADPGVNAFIRSVPGGYLIEMTWHLYWLAVQFCGAIAASTVYQAADGSGAAEAVATTVAQAHFQRCLEIAVAGKGVAEQLPWRLDGTAQQECEFYVEMLLQFALAHELGHLLEGHLDDDYRPVRDPKVRVPGHLYSKSEELTADQIGALLVSGLFDRGVPTQFYGPMMLFEMLDAVDMYGIASGRPKNYAQAITARAATSHPHPSYRTESAIRAALYDTASLDLGMCDRLLRRAEIIAGSPDYARDLKAAQRLYDNYDHGLRGRLLELFNPPWDGRGVRIVDEDAVGVLVEADEREAIACLNTVGALYLDQVQSGLRVVSIRIQAAVAHIYTLFHRRYLMHGTPSPHAQAAADDLKAAIPEWGEIVMLWHQLGLPNA